MKLTVNRNIIVFFCFLPVCWSNSSSCKLLRLVNTTYHQHFPSLYTQVEGVMCDNRNVHHNMNYYIWYHSINKRWSIGLQSGPDVQCDYKRGSITTNPTVQFPQDSSLWYERIQADEQKQFQPTAAKLICEGCKVLRLVNTTYHHDFPSHYTQVDGVLCDGRNVYHNGNYYIWYQYILSSWHIGQQNGADVQCDYKRGTISSVYTATIQFPEDSPSWYEKPDEHATFKLTDAKVICNAGPTNLIGTSVPLLSAIGSGGVLLMAVVVVVGFLLFRRKKLNKNDATTDTITKRNDTNQDMLYAECGNTTEEIIPMHVQDSVKTEQSHQIMPVDNQDNHADDDVIIDNQLYGQVQNNPHLTSADTKDFTGHELGPKGDVYAMVLKSPAKMQAKQDVKENINVGDNYEDACVENTSYGMI